MRRTWPDLMRSAHCRQNIPAGCLSDKKRGGVRRTDPSVPQSTRPRYHAWAAATCANSGPNSRRSEEHTSELQSLMRISYAVFCLKKKNNHKTSTQNIVSTTQDSISTYRNNKNTTLQMDTV